MCQVPVISAGLLLLGLSNAYHNSNYNTSRIGVYAANYLTLTRPEMEWTQYHPLPHIYKWLDFLALKYPFLIKSYTFGRSYEGRPIKALKLSRKRGNKAIFVESSIHANEWISSATSTCFLNNLLYSRDSKVRHLTWNYDWIFVPVANPDGLEYTHNVNPVWRKNRRPNGHTNGSHLCIGTDLNRNFDFMWKVNGYNNDVPCDDWYAGPAAASEPEVQALQNFVDSFAAGYIRMYLALHSFGNLLLLPNGHTSTEFLPNYAQMLNISKGFADAARLKYGTDFVHGGSGALLSKLIGFELADVSGSAKDWTYSVKNIPYTATIELRDSNKFRFFLPPDQILEVCAEVTDGFVGLIKAAESENLFD